MIQRKKKKDNLATFFFLTSVCCWTNKRRIYVTLLKDVIYAHTKKILEEEKVKVGGCHLFFEEVIK